MEKSWILVEYTHYGDDWETEYKEVFENEEQARRFEQEHRDEHKNVNGIEDIVFYYSKVTEKDLRRILTVSEYIEIFPEVKEFLDSKYK